MLDLTLTTLRGTGMGLSDARVIREGPTITEVYIDMSTFYGACDERTMAGAERGGAYLVHAGKRSPSDRWSVGGSARRQVLRA